MPGEYISANPPFENLVTMSNDVKENLKSQSTWMRGLYFLIYAVEPIAKLSASMAFRDP
jgi:hypothetical protein